MLFSSYPSLLVSSVVRLFIRVRTFRLLSFAVMLCDWVVAIIVVLIVRIFSYLLIGVCQILFDNWISLFINHLKVNYIGFRTFLNVRFASLMMLLNFAMPEAIILPVGGHFLTDCSLFDKFVLVDCVMIVTW